MHTKKAAEGRPVELHTRAYPRERTKSNRFRKIFPGRDRRLPQMPTRPPTPARRQAAPDGVPLGLLVLGLQGCRLPPPQRQRAWGLVDKWLRQLVEAKHGVELAA